MIMCDRSMAVMLDIEHGLKATNDEKCLMFAHMFESQRTKVCGFLVA